MVPRDKLRLCQRSSEKGLMSNYYRSWSRQEVMLPAPPWHVLLHKRFLAAEMFGKILIMWLFPLFRILLYPQKSCLICMCPYKFSCVLFCSGRCMDFAPLARATVYKRFAADTISPLGANCTCTHLCLLHCLYLSEDFEKGR